MAYQVFPIVTEIPADDTNSVALATRALPQHVSRIGFTKAIPNGVDSTWGSIVATGAGMTVNQTAGNLVITSGTTVRAETIIRSTGFWQGGIRLRVRNILSQRIINQNFFIELVDVVGDELAYNITSPTTVVVTIPSSPFTAENIGQSVYIGLFNGTGTFLGGRYPIASISGNDVTFTVAGFAVGTGTCSLFGWNYYQLQYQGTTATSVNYDTQRNGYASGFTTATINTTAAPGHLAILTGNDLTSTLSDQLVVSSGVVAITPRASRVENVPDDMPLRLQVRIQNLGTAPASSTTWTIGLISIGNYANQDVVLQDVRPMTNASGLPVEIVRGVSQAVTGTVTANLGTNSVVTNVGSTAQGAATYSSTISNATTTLTQIKSGATTVNSIHVSNSNITTGRYLKIFNSLSASVTMGTTNANLNYFIPAGQSISINCGAFGIRFATGFTIAITGGITNNDNTATGVANEVVVTTTYF
jgi:hypothetical protein